MGIRFCGRCVIAALIVAPVLAKFVIEQRILYKRSIKESWTLVKAAAKGYQDAIANESK